MEILRNAGKTAEDAGLSKDQALEYAKKSAIAYFQDELELLNLTHPYAESAEGLIALASGAKRADILRPKAAAPPGNQ